MKTTTFFKDLDSDAHYMKASSGYVYGVFYSTIQRFETDVIEETDIPCSREEFSEALNATHGRITNLYNKIMNDLWKQLA